MIFFKSDRQKEEFRKLDVRLKLLFFAIMGLVFHRQKYYIIVTDCWRSHEEDNQFGGIGIHCCNRALDFNFCNENKERIYDTEFAGFLCEKFNKLVPYGYGNYPTLLYHKVKGDHFHLQVSREDKTCILKS